MPKATREVTGRVVDSWEVELEGRKEPVTIKISQYDDGGVRFVIPKFGPALVDEIEANRKQIIVRVRPKPAAKKPATRR